MKNTRPIGIFDSGVGGLTVLRQVEKLLPRENIVYFGDTARVPYGNKSRAAVLRFSAESFRFLTEKKVKMGIVACNTSSSLALMSLRRMFPFPVLGVVEAGVRGALRRTRKKRIGVIGTRATIKSGSYERAILRQEPKAKIFSEACPLFVPLAEEGITRGNLVQQVIDRYLRGMRSHRIDTLILGCTHYPLLKTALSRYFGAATEIVDSAEEVALFTRKILEEYEIKGSPRRKGKVEFYVSDEPEGFSRMAGLFLRRKVLVPKVVYVSH
ncbi:MAG: glutamate racemase [Candidatus Omnitrophica bacterium]|nr:glutamate racemase [Candidatus Omnitrophota bacterium]